MTNHYQLDSEYRNRQMAQAEKARLAQEAQAKQPKRNILSAIVNKVQQLANNRQHPSQTAEAQPVIKLTDTQNIPVAS